MRRKTVSGIMLTLFLASVLSIWTQSIAAQPSGMVAYWRLNEGIGTTASDSVGDNDGTLINGPTWTTGIVDDALSFDGANDYIEVPSFQNLTFNEFTISVWVKPVSGNINNNRIITIHDGVTPDYHYFDVETTTIRSICVYIDGDEFMDHDRTLNPDIWTHIGVTYDCSTVKAYIDGELIETGVKSASSRNGILYIGGVDSPTYPAQIWDGVIDEVAIYNRTLTPEEIQQHYQNGLLGLGYYSELTVTSSPITGIPFTINGTPQTTPYTEWLLEGYYTLEMPETHNGYVWSHWLEDGDPNRIKTILLQGTTWTAVYEPAPEPVGGKATPINIPINKPETPTLWIWLSTIILPLVAIVLYVKKRKKNTARRS